MLGHENIPPRVHAKIDDNRDFLRKVNRRVFTYSAQSRIFDRSMNNGAILVYYYPDPRTVKINKQDAVIISRK